jgi:hypothetical protein
MTHDYIPKPDPIFANWIVTLIAFITAAKCTLWNIPQTALDELKRLQTVFATVYAKYLDPNHGKADTEAKIEARKDLEKYTRQFVKEHLTYNSAVTNEDRRGYPFTTLRRPGRH